VGWGGGGPVWGVLYGGLQLHDWKGLQETRRELLVSKGNNKQNWVGFILSHFLSGNYDVALEVVDCYVSTLPEDQPADSESSEIEMFKALVRAGGALSCGLWPMLSFLRGTTPPLHPLMHRLPPLPLSRSLRSWSARGICLAPWPTWRQSVPVL
jgi:hypothetical protein